MSDITVFEVGKNYSNYEYLPDGELDCISMKTVKFRTAQSILTTNGQVFRVFVSDNCEHAVPYALFNNGTIIKASDIIKPSKPLMSDEEFMESFFAELLTLTKSPEPHSN